MTLYVGKCPTCHPIVSKINKLWQKCGSYVTLVTNQGRHKTRTGAKKMPSPGFAVILVRRYFPGHFHLSKNVCSKSLI